MAETQQVSRRHPCPFCAGANLDVYSVEAGRFFLVRCLNGRCRAVGPEALTPEEAWLAWDGRLAPVSPPAKEPAHG